MDYTVLRFCIGDCTAKTVNRRERGARRVENLQNPHQERLFFAESVKNLSVLSALCGANTFLQWTQKVVEPQKLVKFSSCGRL